MWLVHGGSGTTPACALRAPLPRLVLDTLDVAVPAEVNLFETTIRVLGGLLSAHHLAARGGRDGLALRLAERAAALGARMMGAFDSPSGIPYSDVNLRTGMGSSPQWASVSSLSGKPARRGCMHGVAWATAAGEVWGCARVLLLEAHRAALPRLRVCAQRSRQSRSSSRCWRG